MYDVSYKSLCKIWIFITGYINGSQTGRRDALVRREILPGAPRKRAKVVAFLALKPAVYLKILS